VELLEHLAIRPNGQFALISGRAAEARPFNHTDIG